MNPQCRNGQAMMELAIGLFALVLVVTALCGFALYISKSLKMQNNVRVGASTRHDSVSVTDFAAKYVFGVNELPINEKAAIPLTTIAE